MANSKDKYLADLLEIDKRARVEASSTVVNANPGDFLAGLAARQILATVSPELLKTLTRLGLEPGRPSRG